MSGPSPSSIKLGISCEELLTFSTQTQSMKSLRVSAFNFHKNLVELFLFILFRIFA